MSQSQCPLTLICTVIASYMLRPFLVSVCMKRALLSHSPHLSCGAKTGCSFHLKRQRAFICSASLAASPIFSLPLHSVLLNLRSPLSVALSHLSTATALSPTEIPRCMPFSFLPSPVQLSSAQQHVHANAFYYSICDIV